jgi:hypothetical protein
MSPGKALNARRNDEIQMILNKDHERDYDYAMPK